MKPQAKVEVKPKVKNSTERLNLLLKEDEKSNQPLLKKKNNCYTKTQAPHSP